LNFAFPGKPYRQLGFIWNNEKNAWGGCHMICSNCGRDEEIDWSFCPFCGTRNTEPEKPIKGKGLDVITGMLFKQKKSFQDEGTYGSGVRQQVFEVIVRQAIAGAPWKEICAGPMQVNKISVHEVEEEIARRSGMLDFNYRENTQKKPDSKSQVSDSKQNSPPRPDPTSEWRIYSKSDAASSHLDATLKKLTQLLKQLALAPCEKQSVDSLVEEMSASVKDVIRLESLLDTIQREIDSNRSFDREINRTSRPFEPPPAPEPRKPTRPDDPHCAD